MQLNKETNKLFVVSHFSIFHFVSMKNKQELSV